MLLCDDVQRDPTNPHKVNILGLVSTIRSTGEPPFPFRHPELCVYVVLTGGRGTGGAEVAAIHADSDRLIFSTPPHALTLGTDPLAVRGMAFLSAAACSRSRGFTGSSSGTMVRRSPDSRLL